MKSFEFERFLLLFRVVRWKNQREYEIKVAKIHLISSACSIFMWLIKKCIRYSYRKFMAFGVMYVIKKEKFLLRMIWLRSNYDWKIDLKKFNLFSNERCTCNNFDVTINYQIWKKQQKYTHKNCLLFLVSNERNVKLNNWKEMSVRGMYWFLKRMHRPLQTTCRANGGEKKSFAWRLVSTVKCFTSNFMDMRIDDLKSLK